MSKIQSPFIRSIMTIGELPTQFTESMSYYEALVWLTNYLENVVVKAINEDAGAIEELREYVTHYFDSLDLQKEINEKLDDMAEAGQLQAIMAAYFDNFPLGSDDIAPEAITNSKLATAAVSSDKIGDNAITAEKVADNAITAGKIAENGVTSISIQNSAVTEAKLADGSVTTPKLASNAVTSAKIGDSAVTAGKIANNAVTTATIANSAVTGDKIANKTIGANKLNIDSAREIRIGDVLIQTGWFTVESVPTDQQVDYSFTYPTAFDETPIVLSQVASWRANPFCWIYQGNSTGFTARVGHNQGSTVSLTFMWIAVGKKSN